jgi:hypothetical protein
VIIVITIVSVFGFIFFRRTLRKLRDFLTTWRNIDDCVEVGFKRFLTAAMLQGLYSSGEVSVRPRKMLPKDFDISFVPVSPDGKTVYAMSHEVQQEILIALQEIDTMVAETNYAPEVSLENIDFFEFKLEPARS